jgi:hypothetical protein
MEKQRNESLIVTIYKGVIKVTSNYREMSLLPSI